jgi:uroporphyrinogen-III decarboxylase
LKNSLAASKAMGSRYAWVMLHKGFDNFISERDYAELYWPYLRKWIAGLVEEGITPIVYTEGSYTTRLKFLADVPKNKVVYHFEEVDLRKAKQTLGDVACIMGAFPVYTLMYGTKEQIVEKVKETFDTLAPGGGYLFATSCSMDHCPRGNLETLFDAVEKYGKY